ncbi:MAG: tetratricopeptide repeat protein [Candidatus Omnitrophica bacterium]|jgi:Flp pilus assembly protein TadD|nr:tetratricopeptide repeat protein [Candidatus Omnitrophota bacterium]MDD5077857.1 tetratricopeptide repeat protein [Candidatus Omnitrophota bacterium]
MSFGSSARFKSALPVFLIILFGFTIYFNSLRGGFIWDDAGLVRDNLYLRSWSNLGSIFTGNIWAGIGEGSMVYRPLQVFTYLIDYSLWGLNPFGYHLTNLILHILAALTVYRFVKELFCRRTLALFAGILFLAHPAQVEAVSYISGRADSLAAIFLLWSFIFYIRSLKKNNIFFPLAMSLSFILALLSRENAIILPALLLLYHYAFKERFRFKAYLPCLAIGAVYIFSRFIFMASVFYDVPAQSTLIQRLPGFFVAFANYLRILFLPFDLHMEYGNFLFGFRNPGAIAGAALIFILVFAAVRIRDSSRLACFSILWFLVTLFPVSNLYPINSYMAEHWLYLPLIGFAMVVGRIFEVYYRRHKAKALPLFLFACLASGYGYLTFRQNDYWNSGISFFRRTLKYAPRSTKVYYNLGNLLSDAGDSAGGIKMYQEAIRINPRYAEAYNNIGSVYISLGKNREGEGYCLKALEINPLLPSAYYNLSNAYYNLGLKEKALEAAEEAVRLNPFYPEAYNNLAAGYAEKGEIARAVGLWEKCVKLDPDFTAAHFNLAVFYFNLKQYEAAVMHADKVIALGGVIDPVFMEKLKPYRGNK